MAGRLYAWAWMLMYALLMNAHGQPPQKEDFSISVGVEEVRIDATVLDKKGLQISGLTADDFEIYQDGKPQKIISCIYISDSQKRIKTKIATPEASKAELLISKPPLLKDEVQRTIAFVVDGGVTYEARIAIQKFVETQMGSGDLATFLGAGAGVGALQKFSSDKRELLSRIKNLARVGIGGTVPAFMQFGRADFVLDASLSYEARISIATPRYNCPEMTDDQYIRYLKGKIAPIRYGIRALLDMPGRKYLILMSSEIYYYAHKMPGFAERLFNEAANEAWRAGVVISTLDMKGLTGWQRAPACEQYLPLSKKTGGIVVENSNFLFNGIKPVQEAIRGYYLLSYIPPENTFDSNRKDIYHRIKVKAKRPGSEVHSRDGFIGSSGLSDFAAVPQANTLQQSIFSPFLYNDINLSLFSGFAHTPASGYFSRSWLHLDGNDLTFKEEKDGGHSLSLQLEALTADSDGKIQDSKGFQYDFRLSDDDIARIRKDGIDLNSYLPVKNPGDYYVRAAIKDKASGKIGSGYQFLEVPDLGKRRLSLSSIFVLNNGENASNIELINNSSDRTQQWQALSKSPALRSYLPGEGFDYATFVYNAKTDADKTAKLEFQFTIFKDGQVFYQESPEDLALHAIDDSGRIPIIKRLDFTSKMEEGSYVLYLTVKDKLASGKSGMAVQAIDFQIQGAGSGNQKAEVPIDNGQKDSSAGNKVEPLGIYQEPSDNNARDFNYWIRKAKDWRMAAVQHKPGEPDEPAVKIGRWPASDLELIIGAIVEQAGLSMARKHKIPSELRNNVLAYRDFKIAAAGFLGADERNLILKKGALLHSDIALLRLEKGGDDVYSQKVISTSDGLGTVEYGGRHWEFARLLLDCVKPGPSKDEMVRHWYIATTAHMLRLRDPAHANPNLRRALELFPYDAEILFFAGVLYQNYAAPSFQNALSPPGAKLRFRPKERELYLAWTFLWESVHSNPGHGEARLRLGRVLSLRGDHKAAVSELQKSAVILTDPKLKYCNSLFLGYEFALLGQNDKARECFENAAALYPNAQSPLLALSHLARSRGDFQNALLGVQRIFALPPGDFLQDDPWWEYDLANSDAAALIAGMRKEFGDLMQ